MPPTRRWPRRWRLTAPSTALQALSSPRLALSLAVARRERRKITPGFRLPARYVIHAVGPVWGGGQSGEDRLLACLLPQQLWPLPLAQGLASIAFPAISTGIYGFPPDRAAAIAVATVLDTFARRTTNQTRRVLLFPASESQVLHETALLRRSMRANSPAAPTAAPCAFARAPSQAKLWDWTVLSRG